MIEQVLISALTFVIGTTLGGAVATIKGIKPVREEVGRLATDVKVLKNQVGEVLDWQDRWEERWYQQSTKGGNTA